MKDIKDLSSNIRPRIGGMIVHKAASIQLFTMTGDRSTRTIMVGHCLQSVHPILSQVPNVACTNSLCMVHVSIHKVGGVNPGDVSVVPKHSKVSI